MSGRGDHDCQFTDGTFICHICARKRSAVAGDPVHPEGIWGCEHGHIWAEYINGCPKCEVDGIRASVRLIVLDDLT
jgi:hypothetical protein